MSLSVPPRARAVARGPFPQALNRDALFKARNDMTAGEIKAVKDIISVRQELPLLVREEAAPEVYRAAEDDGVEVGPFEARPPFPPPCPFPRDPGHPMWGRQGISDGRNVPDLVTCAVDRAVQYEASPVLFFLVVLWRPMHLDLLVAPQGRPGQPASL